MNKKENKKNKFEKFLARFRLLFFTALAGFFGAFYMNIVEEQYFAGRKLDIGEMLYIFSCAFIVIYLIIIIHIYVHETGHMIGGLITGYKFHSIRYGSFMIMKTEKGLKLCRFTLAGTGGQCLMLPPETDNDDFPVALYNWGGCIGNFVFAVIGLIIFLCARDIIIISFTGMILTLFGIAFGTVNAIPLSTLSNDGYNVSILMKDAKARRAFRNQLKINNCLSQGMSIKEMPKEWFEWEQQIPENNLTASAAVMKFGWLMELGKYDEAKELGNYILDNACSLAKPHESMLKGELIYCDIMLGKDKEQIKQNWEKNKKDILLLRSLPSIQRILYAYYKVCEMDEKKAGDALKNFEHIVKRYPYQAEVASERVMIEKINKLENEKAAV